MPGRVVNTLIIDDEPFVREDLCRLLRPHDNVKVTGEAGTVDEAIQQLHKHFFDLIFLDISLKDKSGFDLIPFIDERSNIVFVSGYGEYALKAFEINALDYLLKPVFQERMDKTLGRLSLEQKRRQKEKDRVYIKLETGGRYVAFNDIAAISSVGGNYLTLFLAKGEQLVCRSTLKYWENLLPVGAFLRIHRSLIVNLRKIETISPEKSGTVQVRLFDQADTFRSSRRMAAALKRAMKGKI